MSLWLKIHLFEAEPYRCDTWGELEDAIANEARTLAEDAGSDEIDDPSPEARAAYQLEIMTQALVHLRQDGDTWRDPNSVLWSLEVDDEEEVVTENP